MQSLNLSPKKYIQGKILFKKPKAFHSKSLKDKSKKRNAANESVKDKI